jgi:hypothetical protein
VIADGRRTGVLLKSALAAPLGTLFAR